MSKKHDTRRFIHQPFPADFQYDGLRAFDTSFSFTLTTPFNYTGRDVLHRSRRFELWSPNSSRLPVYPGLTPANFNMIPPLQYPRVDGSGGRFDWTLNPQYFVTNRLHLPFIMTPEHASRTPTYLPEFAYLTSVWISHPIPARTRGILSREFITALSGRAATLEEQRVAAVRDIPDCWEYLKFLVSEAPTVDTLSSFVVEMEWEECVSQVTVVQRQLREKQAWLKMLKALRSTSWSFDIAPVVGDINITPALDSFMGCWVNGARERPIRWLLHLGIPCFIIHEYRVGVDFGDGVHEYRSRHVSESFCPAEVWHLRADVNGYDFVAKKNETSFATAHQVVVGPSVSGSADALARSASHFHGHRRTKEDLLAAAPEEGSIDWPVMVLFPDHLPWVKPPPIAAGPPPTAKGKWKHFAETILEHDGSPLNGSTVMMDRGVNFRNRENWGYGPFFDRTRKRQLWFENLESVPGLVGGDKFGRPVPFYHFVNMIVGNQPPVTTSRSTWMYTTMSPSPGDIDLEQPPPLQIDLPRFTNIPPEFNDGLDDDADDIIPKVLALSPTLSAMGLVYNDEPMVVEKNTSQLPMFLSSTKEPLTPLPPSPSEARPPASPGTSSPSIQEVSMESPSTTPLLRPLTPPVDTCAIEPSSPHRMQSSPPSRGDVIEDPGPDSCHSALPLFNLDSRQVTPSPEEVTISDSGSHCQSLSSLNPESHQVVLQTPPIPVQSTILPILSYTSLSHEPSSSRFVVISGVDLEITVAEIVATLGKPIVPGPRFSGCGILVRACARLPAMPEDERVTFVIECQSEQEAALVCCLVDGRSIRDKIVGARLASDDLIQTVMLKSCDHPPSTITSHLPSLLKPQSSLRTSESNHKRSLQLGKNHSFNLSHHQSYQRLVSDGEGTLSLLQSRRKVQTPAINNAAARLRIARREGQALINSQDVSKKLESQALEMTLRHMQVLGDYVDKLRGL